MSNKPPIDPALQTLSPRDRIDKICDRFERQWLSGLQPPIRDFLDSCNPSERSDLFTELLLLEIEYLRTQDRTFSKQEYIKKFPDYVAEIETVHFRHGIESTNAVRDDDTQIASPAAGTQLAHFELLRKLGAGSAGDVWKARDVRLKRIVAIKIPHNDNLTENELRRFEREGQAAAQLQHPNIVAIYEVGRDKGLVYIVSEFIDGMNLREWLKYNLPSETIAADLCAQIAEALHHAHEQGIVHRDLKPANILIDDAGKPHITDFGLAKWIVDDRSLTLEGQLLGTPAYMAPEQARGETSRIDQRSDVYTLGVLLFELLTGQYPFQGKQAAVIHAIIHDNPPQPRSMRKSIPRDLETVCLKALEKEPNQRYPSAIEFAVDLRRYLRGETIYAKRSGPLKQSWRWLKRHPAIAASILLTLIACGSFASAMNLADKNRKLLGLRTVTLATEPAGAKVAFVPLSKTTGEPEKSKVVYASGVSPVEEDLVPGDYFVVAVMNDGRFHEVYRHVPDESETIPGSFYHRSSRQLEDGLIQLPRIKILPQNVTEGMTLIPGCQEFVSGIVDSRESPTRTHSINSFHVDNTEFTYKNFVDLYGDFPRKERANPPPENWAFSSHYDFAVASAEHLGKRLPSEYEYEYLATALGKHPYPWGDGFPEYRAIEFGPVGTPKFDRLVDFPSILGLCSGKAEWTSSLGSSHPARVPGTNVITLQEYRVVRGGTSEIVQGNPAVSPQYRNPRQRSVYLRSSREPGLGFRCVRSAAPLITYNEIP